MRKLPFIVLLSLFFINSTVVFAAVETSKIVSEVEKLITAGRSAPQEQVQALVEELEKKPEGLAEALVEKCRTKGVSDDTLTVYVWAIGLAGDRNAVDALIDISKSNKSVLIKGNVYKALAGIGGEEAGKYLLSQAKKTRDEDSKVDLERIGKFDILDLLAQMQYGPALGEMEGLLKKDYEEYYWQQIFCFGKMGDKSTPFLLKKINDKDANIRMASIALLGQTLIAEEAAKPLAVRYWKEKDPHIKLLILSSLEKISSNLTEMERFFKEVVKKEKGKDAKTFAEETITNLGKYRDKINEEKAKKKENLELFKKEYNKLFKSMGHEGSAERLAVYSSVENEPELKKLRERILLRNSDECFYDHDKVNTIITFNRLIAEN